MVLAVDQRVVNMAVLAPRLRTDIPMMGRRCEPACNKGGAESNSRFLALCVVVSVEGLRMLCYMVMAAVAVGGVRGRGV